jgi:protein TonB
MDEQLIRAPEAPRRWQRLALAGLATVAVLGLLAWGVVSLTGDKQKKPRKPQVVSLLPDKPPPPPPPKEEKKPEPPKEDKKEMKVEPPKEAPVAQNEPLKMEGAAGDGDGAFSSGSVGRDYTGGNIGGMQQGLFAGKLQRHIQEELNRNRKLRESDYRIVLRVWLRRDGSVERAELAASTGHEPLDQLLREALMQIGAMREAPPENLPQPMRIRVTARGAA